MLFGTLHHLPITTQCPLPSFENNNNNNNISSSLAFFQCYPTPKWHLLHITWHPFTSSCCPMSLIIPSTLHDVLSSSPPKSILPFDVPQHHLTILPWHVVFPSSPLSPKLLPHYFWTYIGHLQTLKKLAKPKIYQGHPLDPKDVPKKRDVGNLGHDISFVGVFSIYRYWVTNFVVYMITFSFFKGFIYKAIGCNVSFVDFFLCVGIGCSPLLSTYESLGLFHHVLLTSNL
jgi:hypothetical protein